MCDKEEFKYKNTEKNLSLKEDWYIESEQAWSGLLW